MRTWQCVQSVSVLDPSSRIEEEKVEPFRCFVLSLVLFVGILLFVTGPYQVFLTNPLDESLGPSLSYFTAGLLKKKP
ncbi:hypothetical protein TNCV_2093901 [Trichonephila clavipes]|nr:hypothetical protein TNCV_2093901 [Trichonephila clavipes]